MLGFGTVNTNVCAMNGESVQELTVEFFFKKIV